MLRNSQANPNFLPALLVCNLLSFSHQLGWNHFVALFRSRSRGWGVGAMKNSKVSRGRIHFFPFLCVWDTAKISSSVVRQTRKGRKFRLTVPFPHEREKKMWESSRWAKFSISGKEWSDEVREEEEKRKFAKLAFPCSTQRKTRRATMRRKKIYLFKCIHTPSLLKHIQITSSRVSSSQSKLPRDDSATRHRHDALPVLTFSAQSAFSLEIAIET